MTVPLPISRRELLAAGVGYLAASLTGCGGGSDSNITFTPSATRTWGMGFGFIPPRPTNQDVLTTIDTFVTRSEYCIVHEELPWTRLLAGDTPDAILADEKVGLINYARGKGLKLIFMGDLDDGLNRGQEAPQLLAAGRSITEVGVQQLYLDYVLAVNRVLQPEVLGLAAETNLIRFAAPTALYDAVKQTANNTADAIRQSGSNVPLMASVQVEAAWGRLTGSNAYVGVETDFADFPFIETLGLSSYPYFGWSRPEDLPIDYYSRLLGSRTLPTMVVEGGWASESAGTFTTSQDAQARYIDRNAELLDHVGAKGWLQLTFTDLDLATFPPPVPPSLSLFASLGLVDINYNSKLALARWDALHARRLV